MTDIFAERRYDNGVWAEVHPLTFGRARLVLVDPRSPMSLLDGW